MKKNCYEQFVAELEHINEILLANYEHVQLGKRESDFVSYLIKKYKKQSVIFHKQVEELKKDLQECFILP